MQCKSKRILDELHFLIFVCFFLRVELVSNYSTLPYRKYVPKEKGKKDDVPEITRDSAFEPLVILKMLQTLRTEMFPIEGRQEDAEEFLSFILNRMNDEMIEVS